MFRLTREIRFAINADTRGDDAQLAAAPTNSYGGFPSLTGLGYYFRLTATLRGDLDPRSNYLLNIKQVDAALRERAIPLVRRRVIEGTFGGGGGVMHELFAALRDAWSGVAIDCLSMSLGPFQSWSVHSSEPDMMRLSQRFEFAATHRLHNPALSEAENRALFGKCNNLHGHGHNYEVQVTLAGLPDERGVLVDVPGFERIVTDAVIDRFDHKNLNVELPEFANLIPSVENIARTIYNLLKPHFGNGRARLAAVTVWETPKTWCEYSE